MTWKTNVVIITGASSGIGAAMAESLAQRGATLALVARRKDRLEGVLENVLPSSPGSQVWPFDLADPEGAAELCHAMWDAFGKIDVLINNAAVPMRRPLQRLSMGDVERTMRINYFSPVSMSLALLPKMIERGSGTIMNVSSLGGRLGIATEAAYSGSKFALAGFSEAAYVDLADSGVRIKLVLPGAIDTEIWDQPDNDAPIYDGPLVPAREVAEGMVAALEDDGFEYYLPDMKAIVEMKTSDVDGFFEGMKAMAQSGSGGKSAEELAQERVQQS